VAWILKIQLYFFEDTVRQTYFVIFFCKLQFKQKKSGK